MVMYIHIRQVYAMDTRVTLRIDNLVLEEIDDFLSRHPEYDSRSAFIRHAVMEYIKLIQTGALKNTGVKIEMRDRLMDMLQQYIDYRYFRDMDDLMTYVFRRITEEGILAKILKGYTSSLNDLRLNEEMNEARDYLKR